MALALVAVVGNFDGWYQATLSAGEIKRPERNLPLGMIGGTAQVGLLYLLVNVVYFRALPVAAFGESTRIGEEATTALLGPAAGRSLAAVVLVSIFGCISSTIIGASRLGLPMAEDAPALRWLARIHPRYRTPTTGIVTLGVWSIVLVLSGSYEALFNYALFASFIFHAITAIALFALRWQQPQTPRPYRVFGYPYVPAVFLVAMIGLVLNTLRERPLESLLSVGIVAIGVPLFFWRQRSRQK
jgi:APA family basic amino acid/polyamine antiporter